MKKKRSYPEQLLEEVYDLSDMLKEDGKSYAERRKNEIMATMLLLIINHLGSIRFAAYVILGFLLGTALNIGLGLI